MLAPGFEWLVAWRHLRDPDRSSHKTLIVGLSLLLLAVVSYAARGAAAAVSDREDGVRPR